MNLQGARIHITGIVQGVGFRPFVYGLATRLSLNGWVRNTSAGVEIEVDGHKDNLEAFITALRGDAPPLSRIDSFQVDWLPVNGFSSFEIIHSAGKAGDFIPISPDVSICPDCLQEMFDPQDRRHRYPFINSLRPPQDNYGDLRDVRRLCSRILQSVRSPFSRPACGLPGMWTSCLAGEG
jgi:hydrogenase maturation protein HypF